MPTLEKVHELMVPNERETTHESPATAWMATERETIGDILIKNAALDGNGQLPMDVAAMAAANYRSALAWRDFGGQMIPSSSLEPVAQMNWHMNGTYPSPQLVSGIAAASEYITLTAPLDMRPLVPEIPQTHDFSTAAEGLEAMLVLIFCSFMPWLATPSSTRDFTL